jgi:hypothetical protein
MYQFYSAQARRAREAEEAVTAQKSQETAEIIQKAAQDKEALTREYQEKLRRIEVLAAQVEQDKLAKKDAEIARLHEQEQLRRQEMEQLQDRCEWERGARLAAQQAAREAGEARGAKERAFAAKVAEVDALKCAMTAAEANAEDSPSTEELVQREQELQAAKAAMQLLLAEKEAAEHHAERVQRELEESQTKQRDSQIQLEVSSAQNLETLTQTNAAIEDLLEEKESMLKEQAAAKDEELERTKEALHERETAMIAGS